MMSLHKIIEFIFSLIMLLFLALVILGILVGISIVQQLSYFEVGLTGQVIFVGGMFTLFIYVMKMVIDRIKEYYRYI